MKSRSVKMFIVAALCLSSACAVQAQEKPVQFSPVEATIEGLHKSLSAHTITCERVIQAYFARIRAFDGQGTATGLNSVIRLNPQALSEAKTMDAQFSETGVNKALYCVPVIVKDNYNTGQMRTTGAAIAFEFNQPTRDAYLVSKLRKAGAIILGKANMDEFALETKGESSLGGIIRNAYDLDRSAGGSSGGTATAVTASFAMVGLGTDTGGSIRIPAAFSGLVGLRPSTKLLSQDGILPLSSWQDTGGPLCRTVADCALVMDALVGFDSSQYANQRASFEIDAPLMTSETQYREITKAPKSYVKSLDPDGLKGAHIGVIRAMFGKDSEVNAVMEDAIATMRASGATVEDVTIPDFDKMQADYVSMSRYEFRRDLVRYMTSWPSEGDGHIRSFEGLVKSNGFLVGSNMEERGKIDVDHLNSEQAIVYKKNTVERPVFIRSRLMQVFSNQDGNGRSLGKPFDALLYPAHEAHVPKRHEETEWSFAWALAPYAQFPALTLPAGMTKTKPNLPVGLEFIGREYDEPTLLKLAYAYEQKVNPRVPPTVTPDLGSLAN